MRTLLWGVRSRRDVDSWVFLSVLWKKGNSQVIILGAILTGLINSSSTLRLVIAQRTGTQYGQTYVDPWPSPMCFFPKLFPQSWKRTVVLDYFVCCKIQFSTFQSLGESLPGGVEVIITTKTGLSSRSIDLSIKRKYIISSWLLM